MPDGTVATRRPFVLSCGSLCGNVGTFPLRPKDFVQYGEALGILAQSSLLQILDQNIHNQEHPEIKVIIGKSTMTPGYMIESGISQGLTAVGVKHVLKLGPVPTCAVPLLTRSMRAVCGVMISSGCSDCDGETRILLYYYHHDRPREEADLELERLVNEDLTKYLVIPSQMGKITQIQDAGFRYQEVVRGTLPRSFSLHNVRVALDCANGAAYGVAPELLREYGAEVYAIGVDPQGTNINDSGIAHPSMVVEEMKIHRADFGITLDGDGKEVGLFNKKRERIDLSTFDDKLATLREKTPELADDGLTCALQVMANMSREELMLCNV